MLDNDTCICKHALQSPAFLQQSFSHGHIPVHDDRLAAGNAQSFR